LAIAAALGLFPIRVADAADNSSATPPHEHVPLDALQLLQTGGFPDFDFLHEVVIPDNDIVGMLERVNVDSLTAYIQHLEDYGTRYADSPQVIEAGYWLENKLVEFGYADAGMQGVAPDGKVKLASTNVVAIKPGNTAPNYRVIVCGHYDSIVSSDQGSPMDSAPGADDNASGTAATLEIARLLSGYELDATVMFVLFTAEETGLHGSRQMAAEFVRDGIRPEDVFVLNMDMIANMDDPAWDMVIYDDPLSRPLGLLAGRITEAYTRLTPVMAGVSQRSDHYPFQVHGYPAIFFHEGGGHPHYHTVNDRLIHLEMDYATEVVRTVLATTLHMARIADPPTAVRAYPTESGELLAEWEHSIDADLLGYHVTVTDQYGNTLITRFTAENSVVFDPEETEGASWITVQSEDVIGVSEPSEPALVTFGDVLVHNVSPNPTSGRTSFDLFIPGNGGDRWANVLIFDATGRLIQTVHNGPLPRGSSRLRWENADAPSGVYFYTVDVAGIGNRRGKIMLVR
jgi:hypothetical protein